VGHLLAVGNVYDNVGAQEDKLYGGLHGYYNGVGAKFLQPLYVVDLEGKLLGKVNYDMNVVDYKGAVVGKVNAEGQMFDKNNRLIGGVVKQGGVRGYDGVYLGYAVKDGRVIELEDINAGSREYKKGEITGNVVPDGHVMANKQIIGEVLPQSLMVDVLGNYIGFSNDHGVIVNKNGSYLTMLLPGGSTNNSIVPLQTVLVIDFSGQLIGVVLPTGQFMDNGQIISGRVLSDGKVISNEGKLLGEVISGEIVIGNDDNVKGRVGFDGKIYLRGNVVGQAITDGLAVDLQNNIIGHVYNIGHTVLANHGEYVGRLSAEGKVLDNANNEVGYIKSNGSFIDTDKRVSGYSLPEVARNRRN
jgi:cytoskeletal protein CcmA (bactofilin family)